MANKKAFPLRIDARVYAALEEWAADEMRSVNGHIEFLLRDALKKSGRLKGESGTGKKEENDG
ncbi:MAG: hypothetical protein IK116_05470 [Firmicutes bacterium]|nr:hypothetical protein [Bacillota bacterium]